MRFVPDVPGVSRKDIQTSVALSQNGLCLLCIGRNILVARKRANKKTNTAVQIAKGLVVAGSALVLAVISYYKWAAKIQNSKGRIGAYLMPVGLVAILSIVGAVAPDSSEQRETVAIGEIDRRETEYSDERIDPEALEASEETKEDTAVAEQETTDIADAEVSDSASTIASEPESESEPEPEPEPQFFVEEIEPEPYVESYGESYVEPEETFDTGLGFIPGTCGDLKAQGLGPFYPGDANYIPKRDRDNDGIACE